MAESGRPRHIAVVMDGNGRWATARGLPRGAGHKAGVQATRTLVENCARRGVEFLTVFAFSSENWNRPGAEVSLLMDLFLHSIRIEVKRLHKHGIRVTFIGDRRAFSETLQDRIGWAEDLTRANPGLHLFIAANYGGRWDVMHAARELLESKVTDVNLDERRFASGLSTGDTPDPDLFIRTGGEQRISNFLLWQLAYTELFFTEVLWPDFDAHTLDEALSHYAGKQRRFGRTAEQLQQPDSHA